MWFSPETEHVCRGRIHRGHRCIRCGFNIEKGERYLRRVWRQDSKSRLFVDHEHVDERDCPEDEIQHIYEESFATTNEPVAICIVAKEVAVVALDAQGNSFTEWQTVFESETVDVMENDQTKHSSNSEADDAIPF